MRRSATGAMDVADNAAVPSGESTTQVPMRKLSDEQWQSLASGLAREIARLGLGPDWTEHNTHDPGITVLELLTYALTDLQYRSSTLDANGRALARRVAQLAESLATATDADDLTAETSYVRDKARRHNRMLHGVGVVSGLGVTLEPGSGAQVTIAPGLALDARGQEIEVTAPAGLP